MNFLWRERRLRVQLRGHFWQKDSASDASPTRSRLQKLQELKGFKLRSRSRYRDHHDGLPAAYGRATSTSSATSSGWFSGPLSGDSLKSKSFKVGCTQMAGSNGTSKSQTTFETSRLGLLRDSASTPSHGGLITTASAAVRV